MKTLEEFKLNENVIEKMRKIVADKQAAKIDGVMVDMFTASAVTQIYDKVNDANKKKMEKLKAPKLADLAFKLMQKSQKENAGEEGTSKLLNKYKKDTPMSERVKDGKLDPLSKMGKSKLTGREVSQYYKANPKQRVAAKDPIVKKAIELALDLGGNMSYAEKEIEKLKKGLSKNKNVKMALQHANEEVVKEDLNTLSENYRKLAQYGMGTETSKSARVGLEMDFYDEKGNKQFGKILQKTNDGYLVQDDKGKKHKFKYHDRVKAKKMLKPNYVHTEGLEEGTWALPKSAKEKKAFKDLMKKPIPLGRDGDDASDKLYNIVGDDQLFDDLYDAGRKNPKGDARDVVRKHAKRLGLKEGLQMPRSQFDMLKKGDKLTIHFDSSIKKGHKVPMVIKSLSRSAKFNVDKINLVPQSGRGKYTLYSRQGKDATLAMGDMGTVMTRIEYPKGGVQKEEYDLNEAKMVLSTPMYDAMMKMGLPQLMKKHDAYVNKKETDKKHTTLSTPSPDFGSELRKMIKKNASKLKKLLGEAVSPAQQAAIAISKKEKGEKPKNECADEKDFKPHMMYDPKTGKGIMAKTYQDHLDLADKGYVHEKPKNENRSFKSARRDAMRGMATDKDMQRKKDDDDIVATDDDRKAADKNPIIQLRRIADLPRGGDMEFKDGKKVKISQKDALKALKGFGVMKKPVEKQKFAQNVGRSLKDLKRILKIIK